MQRPEQYRFHNGPKATLPFAPEEYTDRIAGLCDIMELHSLDAIVLTSMHNVAYYSGFLYCSFGRPYGLVVTQSDCVTISAEIDAGQPWRRSHGNVITYTDCSRDNFWRVVAGVAGTGRAVGVEADHLTMLQAEKLNHFLQPKRGLDIAPATMQQRMVKSDAEIALIRHGAQVANFGGRVIRDLLREGLREIDVATVGRDAMEAEIAQRFPDAEYHDTRVWFQSALNTDGAHNPVTARTLRRGDILSMTCFPVISGYGAALARTMFLGDVDPASLKIWQANLATHDYGTTLLKPGATCAGITLALNDFLAEHDLLRYRTCGYGHSFGILDLMCAREAALELREDIDTVLEPGMVISMAPMLTIPQGQPGAGGYREQDLFIVTEDGAENITAFPHGPDFNVAG